MPLCFSLRRSRRRRKRQRRKRSRTKSWNAKHRRKTRLRWGRKRNAVVWTQILRMTGPRNAQRGRWTTPLMKKKLREEGKTRFRLGKPISAQASPSSIQRVPNPQKLSCSPTNSRRRSLATGQRNRKNPNKRNVLYFKYAICTQLHSYLWV